MFEQLFAVIFREFDSLHRRHPLQRVRQRPARAVDTWSHTGTLLQSAPLMVNITRR